MRTERQLSVDWKKAQQEAARIARWAVIMTKVRIRRVVSRTRWQLVTFYGPKGGESVGVVDLLAIRKDHRTPPHAAMKRGDALQIVLIQVKGGRAAKPTAEDGIRLRAVARRYSAGQSLLGTWTKGKEVQFHRLQAKASAGNDWTEVHDLNEIFR